MLIMAKWMKKRRDPLTLEERRVKGVKMIVEGGLSEHEVARKLGVSQAAVSKWHGAYRDGGGYDALRSRAHTGRPSRLDDGRLQDLPSILLKGAEQYGFSTDMWTGERVARVIEEVYGVRYSPSQVVRILHSLNFSWQKPEGVAREHDEEKVRKWVKDELPKIKKSWIKPTDSS